MIYPIRRSPSHTGRRRRYETTWHLGPARHSGGAAEFSRDIDLAVLASRENLDRLRQTLHELQAEVIAVPPFEREYLERGHAVQFRAYHPEVEGFRIDVMSNLAAWSLFLDCGSGVRVSSCLASDRSM